MKKAIVKVKPKWYCILWLITHGFIPRKYFWFRKFKKIGTTSHLIFDYDKYKLCGKIFPAEKYLTETWEVNVVWNFPESLLTIMGEINETI